MASQADSRLIQGDENKGGLKPQKVSRFRRYLPQVNKNSPLKYFQVIHEKYSIPFDV